MNQVSEQVTVSAAPPPSPHLVAKQYRQLFGSCVERHSDEVFLIMSAGICGLSIPTAPRSAGDGAITATRHMRPRD